jgi:hypothetical protein
MYKAHQKLWAADTRQLYRRAMPRVAASENDVRAVESLRGPLDPRYREFLGTANGWPAFWQNIDLLGTPELIAGAFAEQADLVLDALEYEDALRDRGVSRDGLMLVAAGLNRLDHFFLVTKGPLQGYVLWFAGQEIERFESFDQYFVSMIKYVEEMPEMMAHDQR